MKVQELEFSHNGETCRGIAQKIDGQLWLHFQGRTFRWRPAEHHSSGQKGSGSDGALLAPMPGKIVKLLKNAGESVEKDEVIVVMEAMKMEYTICAPFAGVLSEVGCSEGDQVVLEQVLAEVKAAES